MAASVGTLKAALVLDTNQFTAKLTGAGDAAKRFGGQNAQMAGRLTQSALAITKIGGGLGSLVGALGPAGIALAAFGAASVLTHRGLRLILSGLADIEKRAGLANAARDAQLMASAADRFGVGLTSIDAGQVRAALVSLREFQGVLRGIGDQILVELAPVITSLMRDVMLGMQVMGNGFKALGITFEEVGNVFVAVGGIIHAQFEALNHTANLIRGNNILGSLQGIGDALTGGSFLRFADRVFAQQPLLDAQLKTSPFSGSLPSAGAFERGSVDAAKAIQGTDERFMSIQHQILAELKSIRANGDPMNAQGRGQIVLQGATI